MKSTGKARKMLRIDDPVTHIGYKIIYREAQDRYEIWTQYKDKYGAPHRNRVMYDEAVKREHDLEALTEYATDFLVGEHVRFYEGEEFEIVDEKPVRQNLNQPKKWKARKSSNKPLPMISEHGPVYNDASGILWKTQQNSKTAQLETLFQEWEIAQKNEPEDVWKTTNGGNINITKDHFRRDGIIDEATFEKEPVKVLFISAEANDNDYSALTDMLPNTVNDYRNYHFSGNETWKGRMRERLAELYKVITGTERNAMSNPEAVMHFAVMDINKRGGGSNIGKGNHIEAYCRYYQRFIRREIEIISPDIVAIVGLNIYDMRLHSKYLGALEEGGRAYFDINKKLVPILRLWQTSFRYAQNDSLPGYEDNLLVGRHAAKCLEEMKKFGIVRENASTANVSTEQVRSIDKDYYDNTSLSNVTEECPNCMAKISFQQDAATCQCGYCGSRFDVESGKLRLYKKKTEKPTTVQKADVQKAKQIAASKRNKNVALLLCIFLGFLGVHNFYCGRYVKGLLFLFTFGLFGIGWICDIFLIISNIYVDADGLKLRTTKG